MKQYNHRKYNQLILKNYIYLSLLESKYAVYYGERIAASIENVLEILQFVFLRDITEEEYSAYLNEIVKVGTYVALKSAEFNNNGINDYALIKKTIDEAKDSENKKNYINSIPKYENILPMLVNAITQNEFNQNLQLVNDEITPVSIKWFHKEYEMLFDCIGTNEDVYNAISTVEELKLPEETESCVLSRDTAIHEIHQGFTHLTRHTNSAYSNDKEIERFKSHIRRAALDFLKLSIESIRNYFIKTNNDTSLHKMSLIFSHIKNQEVSNVVSSSMPDFKQRYTTLINDYIKYVN